MIILNSTSESLILTTSTTCNVDYYVSYVDITSTTTTAGQSKGNITTGTDTTILAAPAASTTRQIKQIYITNKGATVTVTPKHDTSGTKRNLWTSAILRRNYMLEYTSDDGFEILTNFGTPAIGSLEYNPTITKHGFGGAAHTSSEVTSAGGINLNNLAAANMSGMWAPGTPGVAGAALVSGTDSGNMFFNIGSNGYVTDFIDLNPEAGNQGSTSTELIDILWYGTAYDITSTSGQTVNSVTLPARDDNGTTNGEGCYAALIVTTGTTTTTTTGNDTITYTNSAGTASRTATRITTTGGVWGATTDKSSMFLFRLDSGDTGIRSIQTLTLGANRGAGGGAIALIIFRPILSLGSPYNTIVSNTTAMERELTRTTTLGRVYNGAWLGVLGRTPTGGSLGSQFSLTFISD